MEVKLTEIKPEYLHIDYINKNYISKSILRKIVEGWQEWVDLMEEVGIDNPHPPTTKAAIEIRKVDIDGLKQLLDGR